MKFRHCGIGLAMLAAGCRTAPNVQTQAPSEPPPVRILQFYAEPVVAKGETTKLCYGVENAATLKLDPPVERVWPAVARCFPVSPEKATRYTLTAVDAQGRQVSQTVDIRVGPARPRIIEVSINKLEVKAGEEVTVCYHAANAVSVDAGPGRWLTTRDPQKGCLSDRPRKSTTYQVRVTGAGGDTDQEKVSVTVRP